MGTNKRYAARIDADAHLSGSRVPLTLPQQAYGGDLEWTDSRPPVWAWIYWIDGPAERIPAVALGWNDRVVVIGWQAEGGDRKCVVWRNAVSRRTPAPLR